MYMCVFEQFNAQRVFSICTYYVDFSMRPVLLIQQLSVRLIQDDSKIAESVVVHFLCVCV